MRVGVAFFLVLFSVGGHGMENVTDLCRDQILGAARSISPNPNAVVTARELASYGRLATNGALSELEEGRYVFAVNSAGEVIFSPAVPSLDVDVEDEAVPLLVSHRSLSAFENSRTGQSPQFIVAGDFTIARPLSDSQGARYTQVITNRSNTYPAGTQTLNWGAHFLSLYGLCINSETALIDYSNGRSVDRHVAAEKQAIDLILYKNHPEMVPLRSFISRLVTRYPSQEIRNQLDSRSVQRVLEKLWNKVDGSKEVPKAIKELVWFSYLSIPKISEWGLPTFLRMIHQQKVTVDEFVSALSSLEFPEQSQN
jgi:hypothetical protein